jgi:molybdopterin converting factor small subunit
MAVVKLRGPLKRLAEDRAEHAVAGGSVAEVLQGLEAAQPGLRGWVLDERGRLRRHLNVFVDGEPGREDTAVGPDARVDVLPAISGG